MMGLRRKTQIDDFPCQSEQAMIGDNTRKLARGRPKRSALPSLEKIWPSFVTAASSRQ
jgi:hypothetical protein